jgi:hypothetical protein
MERLRIHAERHRRQPRQPYSKVLLIQVKSDTGSPFTHFGPYERRELIAAAEQAGGEAWLVWWPPRKPAQWIPPHKWPTTRVAA